MCFFEMYENSYGFFREKMMWYFSSMVLFVLFSVVLLRCAWGMLHGSGYWGGMFEVSIVGFG